MEALKSALFTYLVIPVLAALGLAAAGLVTAALSHLASFLKAKANEGADDMADRVVVTIVESVFAHLGEELSAAVADGKVSDEEKTTLRAHALVKAQELLSASQRLTLERAFGAERVDLVLEHKIAAAVAAKSAELVTA